MPNHRAAPPPAVGNKKSFMDAIMARASAYDSESEDSSTQYTDETDPASRPQTNSLALALGMKIDSSKGAPAIRASGAAAQHTNRCAPVQNKKSFMNTVLLRAQGENDSDSSGTEVTDNLTQPLYAPNVLPQPKSLADALDMRVDPVSTAPMIRSGKVDPAVAAKMSRAKGGKVSETIVQQNGSEDLSVSEVTDLDYDDVDVSAKSTLPFQVSEAAPVISINGSGKKSFLDTIMERVAAPSDFESSEVSSQSTDEQDQVLSPAVLPQPNSLAAALNMRINPVSTAAPIQEISSPLPPPAEPDDVDNSESQYEADFVTNQPGVPFSLMTESPALESLDQQRNKGASAPERLLERLRVDVAGMRSEMKEAIDDLASTKEDLELLKEEAPALVSKLEAVELEQSEASERVATAEDRAKASEEALRLDLSKEQEQITVMSESISAFKSENDARLAHQETATTKLSEELDQVKKSVLEKVETKASDQSQLVRVQLDELKETIASLGADLEANKTTQETRISEWAEQESSERKTALREQEERIEKQLAVLSQQYSEGLDTLVDKVFQSSQWAGAEGKLAKALLEIQESRALLDKEHEEVQALKKAVDDHFAKLQDCDDSATSFLSDFSEKGEGQTSEVLRSIQMRMRQERLRQKALRKQLKARAVHLDSPPQSQEPPKHASEEQPFDEKASKSLSIPSRELAAESTGLAEMTPIQEDDVIKEVAVTNAPNSVAKDSAQVVEAVADDQSEKVSALSTDGTPEPLIEETSQPASPTVSDDSPSREASVPSPKEDVAPVPEETDAAAEDTAVKNVEGQPATDETESVSKIDDSVQNDAVAEEAPAPKDAENLNGSMAITEETADITGDPSKKMSEESDERAIGHDKLATVEVVHAAPVTEETSNESILIEDGGVHEKQDEQSASRKTPPNTPMTTAETNEVSPRVSPPPRAPRTLEGAVGLESQPLPEALQMQMEMNLLRDQVQDIVSIMAELRQDMAARKAKEEDEIEAGKAADEAHLASKSESSMEYSKLLLTLLGLILLSSSIAYRISNMETQRLQAPTHEQEETPQLDIELEQASKSLETSKDEKMAIDAKEDAAEAKGVDADDDGSVATAPVNQTMSDYFGDDASLSRLDSPVKEAVPAAGVIDSDDSFADAGEMEEDSVVDVEEMKEVDGMDVLVPSSASLEETVEELEAPTLIEEDDKVSPSVLPPSFATIHRFTRPVKDKLASTLGKSARQKMVNKVRTAVEKELNSDQWV
ncbi:MAG: hypothetical protein SGILL_005060 [Bacillariaceae sp.]